MHAARAIGLCQCFIGGLDFQAGHWQAAQVALEEAIQLYRQIGTAPVKRCPANAWAACSRLREAWIRQWTFLTKA